MAFPFRNFTIDHGYLKAKADRITSTTSNFYAAREFCEGRYSLRCANPVTGLSLFPAGVCGFTSDFGKGSGAAPDDASLAGALRQLRIRRLRWLKRCPVQALADDLLQDGAGIDDFVTCG